jgi:hypothetical protein
MYYMFLCFVGSCQHFFLLARSGRKTDGHIINIRMFIKFLSFFLPMQGLVCCYYLRLIYLKRTLLHLAGPRNGRKVLARSRCPQPIRQSKKDICVMCQVAFRHEIRWATEWYYLFLPKFNLCEDFHISPKTNSVCPAQVFCSRQM